MTTSIDQPAFGDDGAVSNNGLVIGTYLHGIFENQNFRGMSLIFYERKNLIENKNSIGNGIEEGWLRAGRSGQGLKREALCRAGRGGTGPSDMEKSGRCSRLRGHRSKNEIALPSVITGGVQEKEIV